MYIRIHKCFLVNLLLITVLGFFCAAHAESTDNFLTLSDIHFSPFADCGTAQPCSLVKRLSQAPAGAWSGILNGKHSPVSTYRQETNYPLLVSALAAAKKTADQKQAKFVMVLGDILAHDYRRLYKFYSGDSSYAGYQSFVQKTYQFVTLSIARAFPDVDVYMAVGNNDSYHGDYATVVSGPFFQDEAALWSGLIKTPSNRSAMRQGFSRAGYYAVNLPNQVKLIVLNTNLFSSKARGKNLPAAANVEFLWLHQQLVSAKATHQTVFVAMHIPEGIDVYATLRIRGISLIEFWDDDYIKKFQAEMNEYAPMVAAIFAGHLHSDWMQILRYQNMREIPVTGTPSISPIFGNNPGYKVYTYSDSAKKLVDFTTYYLPLSNKQEWTMEYRFNHVYQPNCRDCPITSGINLIQKDGTLADYYKLFYAVSTRNQPIVTEWNPYYWCAIWHTQPSAYKNCVG